MKIPSWFRNEQAIIVTGLAGLALSLFCAVGLLVHGNAVPPHGEWMKPLTFNAAIGIFLLTTAVLLPYANWPQHALRRFRGLLVSSTWYSYTVETVQSIRGINPRFASDSTMTDTLIGLSFGIASMTIIVLYVALTVQFFRRITLDKSRLLVLGIRYGLIAVMAGFAAGLWMIAMQGRFSSSGGNVMFVHFIAFHGLQAIPLVAWLLGRSGLPPIQTARLVHAAGIIWLMEIVLASVQTAAGHSVFDWMATAAVFWVLLASWASLTVNAAVFLRKRQRSL